jgi:hypothetical protein
MSSRLCCTLYVITLILFSHSASARFISEDPKGFQAGPNFYAYAGNNPINANDPTGLRPPTDGEIGMLKPTYNGTVNYSKIDIHSGASLDPRSWPPIAEGAAVTLENTIHFPGNGYQADFSKADLSTQSWLVHEVGHVYQYQNNQNYSWIKAAAEGLRSDTYDYTLDANKPFTDYRYEQQASILADYYKATVTGSPQISTFEAILGPQGLGATAVDSSSVNSNFGAAGGFLLYPNKPNTNQMQSVYHK